MELPSESPNRSLNKSCRRGINNTGHSNSGGRSGRGGSSDGGSGINNCNSYLRWAFSFIFS